jgi:carbonic anhydrase
LSRQIFWMTAAALLLAPFCLAGEVGNQPSPERVLARLRDGNRVYLSGSQSVGVFTQVSRNELVAAQHPFAIVLTCADSRVPPEYIFQEGLGALFVVRVAGAVADPVTVGSIEYGVEHLHAPLVVVMGHTRCGAVKAAIEKPAPAEERGGPTPNIESILSLIRPGMSKGPSPGLADAWTTAVYGGVEQSVEELLRVSSIVPEMSRNGRVGLVGAVYDIETGKVSFSGMVSPEAVEHAADLPRVLQWNGTAGARRVASRQP